MSMALTRSSFSGFRRQLATATSAIFPNATTPPAYSLATLRAFPSLEPHSVFPVHNILVNSPLRRDILWMAAVMELDNRRVGASNPPGRSDHRFSRRKLFRQKGTGRARVGDANSPIRENGAYALARTAPNDWSTDLPAKVYHLAYRTALSDAYRKGNLFIIGNESNSSTEFQKGDSGNLEICTKESLAIKQFVSSHQIEKRNLLFITDDYFSVANLRKAILRFPSSKLSVKQKEEVEVRDILKAQRIYIEKNAFDWFAHEYTKFVKL
ncbi:mitochondrial 54S ribosomal protein YmL6 [Martiniozyma asiatica (nom. inval.)]|nr:mitochondrial 54S ribosomal protein YmL6 [Martiniozyma asiatica]